MRTYPSLPEGLRYFPKTGVGCLSLPQYFSTGGKITTMQISDNIWRHSAITCEVEGEGVGMPLAATGYKLRYS